MDQYLTHYQAANLSNEQVISNFVVRKKEFERIVADINTTEKGSSFQHYVIVGRRGSGKSTLLRRIEAEVNTDMKLQKQFIVTNLSEEQAGIYKLYDLWDHVIKDLQSKDNNIINPDWQDYQDDLKEYTKKLYQLINQCLEKSGKRLILLIDNIDRIFKNIGEDANLLREQLMNYNNTRIIGGSTIMSEDYWRYDLPFYQFFSIKPLGPLSIEEIKQLLQHWNKEKDRKRLDSLFKKYPGKIQAIRMLTDGTPRTMLLFVDMILNRPEQNGFDYLRKIIDQATPVYQERLGKMSAQQQKIMVELSFFWEATPIESLIEVCKMKGKIISAQLNQLIKAKIVEKIRGKSKNLLYRLEERFFNMWLLMTQGGPQQKKEVKYLTVFLENWYDHEELQNIYRSFIEDLGKETLRPDYVASMTKALVHSSHISLKERDQLLERVNSLEEISKDWLEQLPDPSKIIFNKANEFLKKGKHEEAVKLITSIEQDDARKFSALAFLHEDHGKFIEAEKYYLKAIDNGHSSSMNNLANLYANQKKFKEAEMYYLKAIEKGNVSPMYNLAILYKNQKKIKKAERYYLMAIENEDVKAMNNLAILYEDQKKYKEAEKYYLKAIDFNHLNSIYNLAILYEDQKKFKEAEKYYQMAIKNGDIVAMYNLAILYVDQKEFDKAEQYYLMAIENKDVKAMNNLAILYVDQKEFDKAEQYYLMAIENEDVGAMHNLASLYEDQKKFKKAEIYYLKAIKNENSNAMHNLAVMYYLQNQNQQEALKLIQKAVISDSRNLKRQLIMNVLQLWVGNIEEYNKKSEKVFNKLLLEEPDKLQLYIKELLIHKQYNYLLNHFEKGEYKSQLKDRFLPYYYTILELVDQNDPRLKRKPPEIEEVVNDIIKEVKRRQKIYYG